jgi:hypothetical protein
MNVVGQGTATTWPFVVTGSSAAWAMKMRCAIHTPSHRRMGPPSTQSLSTIGQRGIDGPTGVPCSFVRAQTQTGVVPSATATSEMAIKDSYPRMRKACCRISRPTTRCVHSHSPCAAAGWSNEEIKHHVGRMTSRAGPRLQYNTCVPPILSSCELLPRPRHDFDLATPSTCLA